MLPGVHSAFARTLNGTLLQPAVYLLAVHLWKYSGGYPALTECLEKLNHNKVSSRLFIQWKSVDVDNDHIIFVTVFSVTYLHYFAIVVQKLENSE